MREILFRGKRTEGEEWVEGWFVGKSRKAPFELAKERTQIIDKDLFCYEVKPATVGQYTGINDSNGKRIFEGDIVTIEYEKTEVTGFVYYRGAAFYITTPHDLWEIDNYCSLRLLGNIYDNADILAHERDWQ